MTQEQLISALKEQKKEYKALCRCREASFAVERIADRVKYKYMIQCILDIYERTKEVNIPKHRLSEAHNLFRWLGKWLHEWNTKRYDKEHSRMSFDICHDGVEMTIFVPFIENAPEAENAPVPTPEEQRTQAAAENTTATQNPNNNAD